jgi:hypothetical protein
MPATLVRLEVVLGGPQKKLVVEGASRRIDFPNAGGWVRVAGLRPTRLAAAALFLGSLLAVFGGPLASHVRLSVDPLAFNRDAAPQLYPFLRAEARTGVRPDYLAEYYSSAFLPAGYQVLYRAAARLGLVRELNRWLPYVLLLLTLTLVGLTAHRFGGLPAAWISAALALSSGAYLGRMAGGIPRAFAFPIAAWILLALVRGSVAGLAGAAIAGALFYPVSSVIAGSSLLLVLFVPAVFPEGQAAKWGAGRRSATVAGVAALCVLAVSPLLIGGSRYGRRIGPNDLVRFPEAGPGGRFRGHNRPPFAGVARFASEVFEDGMSGAGRAFVPGARKWLEDDAARRRLFLGALLAVAGVGWLRSALSDAAARRFLILPVVALLAYVIAGLVYPYLFFPARYLFYTVPPAAYVILAAGAAGLGPVGRLDPGRARWLGAIPGVLALLLLGGRGSPQTGLSRLPAGSSRVYAAIRELPEDSLLAGWPSGAIDYAPWLTGRAALVTFETHQAFHEGYLLELRRRTRAVAEAFYACDARPLIRLRDEFGVTHFLVDLPLATSRSAEYFAPFDRDIARLREQCAGRELEILRRRSSAAVYEDEIAAILDLSRLTAAPEQ